MQTSTQLRGLAAIRLSEGVRLGRIHDVVFDGKSGRIAGFLLDDTDASRGRFLPVSLVQRLGADAVMVGDSDSPLPEIPSQPDDPAAVPARELAGRPVVNEAGVVVGRVSDVQVDEETLAISALLLSGGLLDSVLHRQSSPVPFAMVRAIGADSVVVSGEYDPKAAAPPEETPA